MDDATRSTKRPRLSYQSDPLDQNRFTDPSRAAQSAAQIPTDARVESAQRVVSATSLLAGGAMSRPPVSSQHAADTEPFENEAQAHGEKAIRVNVEGTPPPAPPQQPQYWVQYSVPVVNGRPDFAQAILAQPRVAHMDYTYHSAASNTTLMPHSLEGFRLPPPPQLHAPGTGVASAFDLPQPLATAQLGPRFMGGSTAQPYVSDAAQAEAETQGVRQPAVTLTPAGAPPAKIAVAQGNPRTPSASSAATNSSPQQHNCPHCSKTYILARSLRAHLSTMHNINPYHQCSQCTAKFTTQDKLRDHRDAVHERDERDPAKHCEYCGRAFAKAQTAGMHRQKCPARPKADGAGAGGAGFRESGGEGAGPGGMGAEAAFLLGSAYDRG